MPDQVLKQGDTQGALEAQLTLDGEAFDLSGYDVTFVLGGIRRTPLVDAEATVTNASAGEVEYDWSEGDLSEAGDFLAEWVADDGTDTQTFPSEGYTEIRIEDEVQQD